MYKILIVDDEAPARELLKMKIDWASLYCEIAFMAKNGQEALSYYIEHKPDLIITDIEMPVLNGLQLIKAVKDINKTQPMIILSCHESFSFAQQAIKLGVTDYLIKDSFDTVELCDIITRLFNDTIPAKSTDKNPYPKHHSALIKTLIFKALPSSLMSDYVNQHKLCLNANSYQLFYFTIELGHNPSLLESNYLDQHEIEQILSLLYDSLFQYASGEVCYISDNNFCVIYNLIENKNPLLLNNQLAQFANKIRQKIKESFNYHITVGISSNFNSLALLNNAFDQAKSMTNQKILGGYNKTYFFTATSSQQIEQYTKLIDVKTDRIQKYLDEKQFDDVFKELKSIYMQDLHGFMQYNYVEHVNYTLLTLYIQYATKQNYRLDDVFNTTSPWETIMALPAVSDMYDWFVRSTNVIKQLFQQKTSNTYTYYVQKCITYIENHFHENISLKELSDSLQINNAYLSRLFKKEIGKSLTEYINDIRIEEAKKLINTTSKKMYEIAQLTGFSSTQRFFSTFKKAVGVSPGDYKKTPK